MSENTQAQVYGKALYLELEQTPENGSSVLQLLLTPDMKSPTGAKIPLAMYRRRLTPSKPRATWNAYSPYDMPKTEADGSFTLIGSWKDAEAHAAERLTFAEKLFGQIISHGYKLRKAPIVVEIGVDDLDDICAHKTPYKVLARVTRTRKILGFADSVI